MSLSISKLKSLRIVYGNQIATIDVTRRIAKISSLFQRKKKRRGNGCVIIIWNITQYQTHNQKSLNIMRHDIIIWKYITSE